MKKIIFIIMFAILCLVGCNMETTDETYEPSEEPHLYWKDIDVVITDIEKRHWFARTHWYSIEITVKSEEYNLTETIQEKSCGIFRPNEWDYEEGQVIKAKLYSWVMDSTGEVVRREISQVY